MSEQFPTNFRTLGTGEWTAPTPDRLLPGEWNADFDYFFVTGSNLPFLTVPSDVWRHVYRTTIWAVVDGGAGPGTVRLTTTSDNPFAVGALPGAGFSTFLDMVALFVNGSGVWGNTSYVEKASRYVLAPGTNVWFGLETDILTTAKIIHWRQWFVDSSAPLEGWA